MTVHNRPTACRRTLPMRLSTLLLLIALLLPLGTSWQPTPVAAAGTNPFAGITWVPNTPIKKQVADWRAAGRIDDARLLEELVGPQQVTQWLTSWIDGYPDQGIEDVMKGTYAAGGVPIIALYNVPRLNCQDGNGARDAAAYAAWIDRIVRVIGDRKAIVLLEPDGVTVTYCFGDHGDIAGLNARYAMIADAVRRLKAGHANTAVYLDAGTQRRNTAQELVAALTPSGIAQADGFFLNSTTYEYTTTMVAFGDEISRALAAKGIPDKHFVVDTSRNGRGPNYVAERGPGNREWCNAPDRALGPAPTTRTGDPLADAFVWIKPIWQSDSDCLGDGSEPGGGRDFWEYTAALVRNTDRIFSDLPTDPEERTAVIELARRGVIRGNGDGTFGPGAQTLRAQMAALLARPAYWESERWSDASFPDQGTVDGDLWRNVRTLAHYGVARGYGDGTFQPTAPVLYQQVLLFISRMMVTKGYWTLQADDPTIFPNLAADSARAREDRQYIVTYVHYTAVAASLGGVPGHPAAAPFADYDQPAPRAWFALALYRALLSTPFYLGK